MSPSARPVCCICNAIDGLPGLILLAILIGNWPGIARGDQPVRALPGMQIGGAVLLPNQWSLRPAGKQLELGVFPVNIALHPGGRWLAVLHAGYGEHQVITVDLQRLAVIDRAGMKQAFYGL